LIPPHVTTSFPEDGGCFEGDTIVLNGSLLGLLFAEIPPLVWSVQTGEPMALTWTETVTREWHADAPAVGGDIQTRMEIVLRSVTVGHQYRLRYPCDFDEVSEVVLTAISGGA
jgi:hypothetical protein